MVQILQRLSVPWYWKKTKQTWLSTYEMVTVSFKGLSGHTHSDTHTHAHTHCSIMKWETPPPPPQKKQDRAAKLPARFGRRDGLNGERGTTFEKGLWVLWRSSSKAGGDKQEQEDKTAWETPWGNQAERQIERKQKQGEEQIITAEYKFFLTDQIATESNALHGELGATRRTQHRHERGREEAFRQKVSNLKNLLL